MGGLRRVPCMELSELRMMSVIARSGWGCTVCPRRCACKRVHVMDGWVRAVLRVLSSYNSIVSASTVLFLPARALRPFTLSCYYSCSNIFLSFCTLSHFLSLPLIPMELPLRCYSALSSIVPLIYFSLHSPHLSLFPLISVSLFHIVLPSHRADLTYIRRCRRDPFQMKGFCCQDSRFPLSKYYWM